MKEGDKGRRQKERREEEKERKRRKKRGKKSSFPRVTRGRNGVEVRDRREGEKG